jgi:hypothetical protein
MEWYDAPCLVCVCDLVVAWQLYGVDKKSILHKVELPNFQSSTKLEALMEELHAMQVPNAWAGLDERQQGLICLLFVATASHGTPHVVSGN